MPLSMQLHLRLISDSSGSKHCRYDLSDYVTKQGWNHIEIKISDYFNQVDGFKFSNIKKWRLYFNGTQGQTMPYAATYIMFKNFNGVLDEYSAVPEMIESEGMLTIHKGAKYGGTLNTYSDIIGGAIEYSSIQDFSNYDYFEFDFYVENIDNFNALVSNIRLNLVGSESSNQLNYKFLDQITNSGWNHIKLKASEGEKSNSGSLSAVKIVRFRIGKNSGVTVGAEDKFKIANICATLEEYKVAPELPANRVVTTTDLSTNVLGRNTNNIRNTRVIFDTPIDFSTSDYIEFDFYVENVEHFWAYQGSNLNSSTGGHGFSFYLSPNDTMPTADINFIRSASNKRIFLYFNDPDNETSILRQQITKDGWNHIKISLSAWKTGNGSGFGTPVTDMTYFSNIKSVGMFTSRGTLPENSSNIFGGERYSFANVCGTAEEYKVAPELPANRVVTTTNLSTNVLGRNTNNIRNTTVSFETPLDFSTSDYIEFDFYVENVEHFWAYQGSNLNSSTGGHGFSFYLSPNDTMPTADINFIRSASNKRIFLYFNDPDNETSILRQQITKDGWNHIKISLSAWKTGNGSGFGTPVTDISYFSSIKRVGLFAARGTLPENSSNVFGGERYSFANVCGTLDLTPPTDVMQDKVDLISSGLKTVTFDTWGYSEEVNANINGTRMIELDVYVMDDSNSTIIVDLEDASDLYASYEFKNLTKGWNHLAVRITDMDIEEGFDFENIVGFTFNGVKDTTVYVANFYAANYVDGDGNRDGVTDVKDLIRSKKISAESETKGNIVAMDLAGEDYEVKAEDISALRGILLG